VPARFREVVSASSGDRLVVTTALDRCLHIRPLKAWEELEAKLAQKDPLQSGVKDFIRVYIAPATEVEIDKLGRVLIPPTLRAHAQLEKDVVWAGNLKFIELWSKSGWEEAQAAARSDEKRAGVETLISELGG
jgi:MraZ protein